MADASRQNLILRRLSRDDRALLEPKLESVDLPLRKVLEQANKPIKAIYFPESGFASVVVNTGKPIEVGLIGYEGMTGLSVVLGHDRNANETYVQAREKAIASARTISAQPSRRVEPSTCRC